MLGVRLPEDLDRRLSELAAETKRSKSYYVKEAIIEYLDIHESTYKAVIKYEKEKKAGTLKTYSLEEIMKRNGLTDEDLDHTNV